MATATDVRGIPIIDTDTHVVEPPDLWTSRVSAKWGDLVPHVAWDPVAEEEAWYSGDSAPRCGRGAGDGRAGPSTRRTTRGASPTPTRRRGTPRGGRR